MIRRGKMKKKKKIEKHENSCKIIDYRSQLNKVDTDGFGFICQKESRSPERQSGCGKTQILCGDNMDCVKDKCVCIEGTIYCRVRKRFSNSTDCTLGYVF